MSFIKHCIFGFSIVLIWAPFPAYSTEAPISAPWRAAYMNTFATNGEIINALKHTNISQLLNVELSNWKAFPFAPPINELAISGGLDVVPEGVVPTASLIARDPANWRVVARLIYFPIIIMAREGSGISSLKDLKGKRIGTPFGSGAHPPTLEALEKAGLSEKDATVINLGIPEQIEALRSKRVDAVGTWEPQAAVMSQNHLAKPIARFKHIAFIVLRKDRIDSCRSCAVNVLKAFIVANWYAATHKDVVREWFSSDSRFGTDLLEAMEVIEPNMNVTDLGQVDISLSNEDIEMGNRYAEFMVRHKLLPRPIDFNQLTDKLLAKEAQADLKANPLDVSLVKPLVKNR